jgi:hypothetical protein
MVHSLCLQAIKATFLRVPAANRRVENALITGLSRVAPRCSWTTPLGPGAPTPPPTPPAHRPTRAVEGNHAHQGRHRLGPQRASRGPLSPQGPREDGAHTGHTVPDCRGGLPSSALLDRVRHVVIQAGHCPANHAMGCGIAWGIRGGTVPRRWRSAVSLSPTWRRRRSRARSSGVVASGRGRGTGWTASAPWASPRASIRSIFAKLPTVWTQARPGRGLARPTGDHGHSQRGA